MINKGKSTTVLIFLLILFFLQQYVLTAGTYYQLIPKLSFDFRNKKFPLDIIKNNYHRQGDLIFFPSFLQMTPRLNLTNSSLVSKNPFETNIFEFQLRFKINPDSDSGSFLSVWFYNNNTEPYLNLNSTFEGFGLVFSTKSVLGKPHQTKIHLIINDNEVSMQSAIENYTYFNTEKSSCSLQIKNETVKINIKYDEGSIRVNYNNNDNLYSSCFTFFAKTLKRKKFKIGLFSYNGQNIVQDKALSKQQNSYPIKDEIQIYKLLLMNMNDKYKGNYTYSQDDFKVESTTFDNLKEYDLVAKFNKPKKTIDELITFVSDLKLKLSSSHDISNLNFTYLSESLDKINKYGNSLIKELSILNQTFMDDNKRKELIDNREKILDSEIDALVNKWEKMKSNIEKTNKINGTATLVNSLKNKLDLIQQNFSKTKQIQKYLSKYINDNIYEVSSSIQKKTKMSTFAVILFILFILLNLILLYLIKKKLGSKEKKN